MMYSERLKELKEDNDLIQEEVAGILGITQGRYSNYETEYDIIPLKHLITLCNYYNVSLDYIFGFTYYTQYKSIKNRIDLRKSGLRLKEFRKEIKLSQGELAEELGTAFTTISGYERGRYLIATNFLYDICKKYNVSADYLLGRVDSPKYLK